MRALLAAASDGYEAPGTGIFWQPLFGHGQWTATRAMVLMLVSIMRPTVKGSSDSLEK